MFCWAELGHGSILSVVIDMGSQIYGRIGLKPIIIHFLEMGIPVQDHQEFLCKEEETE